MRDNLGETVMCRKIRNELTDEELTVLKSLFSRSVSLAYPQTANKIAGMPSLVGGGGGVNPCAGAGFWPELRKAPLWPGDCSLSQIQIC